MQIKNTSEKITRFVILKLFKSSDIDYREAIFRGKDISSPQFYREMYLQKGTFIFLLSSLFLAFLSIGLVALLASLGIINYLLFLVFYFPFFFVLSVGTFFNYFRLRTRIGFIESFNSSHLVISIIFGFIGSSLLASTPFI